MKTPISTRTTEVDSFEDSSDDVFVPQETTSIPKKPLRRMVLRFIFSRNGIITIIILALGLGFAYSQYQVHLLSNPNYQQEQAATLTKKILGEVSQLMVLPDGTPQIATVQDAKVLAAAQPFFSTAHNGDVLLVYPDRAILYSPSLNKIVNVGSITSGPSTPTSFSVQKSPSTK
jgi:hypothetical protein